MDLEIRPYEGLGPIRFGMRRDDVRRALGASVRAFRKTPEATILTDAFDDEGIHVYYNEQDLCEAVEVASPAIPVLQGRALVGRSFAEIRDWLRTLDPEVEIDESGLTAFTFGVGLYASSAQKAPNGPVEAVIAFRRGYYR